jgi:hypothetical protein
MKSPLNGCSQLIETGVDEKMRDSTVSTLRPIATMSIIIAVVRVLFILAFSITIIRIFDFRGRKLLCRQVMIVVINIAAWNIEIFTAFAEYVFILVYVIPTSLILSSYSFYCLGRSVFYLQNS